MRLKRTRDELGKMLDYIGNPGRTFSVARDADCESAWERRKSSKTPKR